MKGAVVEMGILVDDVALSFKRKQQLVLRIKRTRIEGGKRQAGRGNRSEPTCQKPDHIQIRQEKA